MSPIKPAIILFPVLLCSVSTSARAAGFIEDSKATLSVRNMYYNSDYRSPNSNPRQDEWGQGFRLDVQSGYTPGTVGFGVDALGLFGLRLDGGGKSGANNSSRNPSPNAGAGNLFPVDSDNKAVTDFSSLGLTAKVKISNTEAKIGTLLPKLPVVVSNDGRLLPQTYTGGQITSKELDGLTLIAGQLESAKGRASSDDDPLSMSGARFGADTNKFYYGGADYQLSKNLLGQYYYGQLENFYAQHFLGFTHDMSLPVGSLKTELRYWYSVSEGKNSSASGRAAGYLASGYYGTSEGVPITRGEVDNRTWSASLTYALGGSSITGAYQKVSGDSNFPFINQGDVYRGSSGAGTYLITERQLTNFSRSGESTVYGQYNYDFAALGVPGLSAGVTYLNGNDIRSANGSLSEWERDIALSYVIQSGPVKGLGINLRNAMLRSNVAGNVDQNRLIFNYAIALF